MNRLASQEISRLLRDQLHKKVDQRTVERWAASFWRLPRQEPDRDGKPFVMMFPPPNITGNLHLGHALTGAIQDALVRQRRMLGHKCIFIPGFDHAGLATQSIVEKQLWNREKLTRQQIGREKFVQLADDWKDKKRIEMRDQLDRLGLQLNDEREYFTMDENSSLAVHAAFKQLFNSGIIYRSEKLIYWSNELKTTLSDIEVERVDGVDRYIRTGEQVEKRALSQWFVDMSEMSKKAIEVVENASIDMIPPNYKRSWYSWLSQEGTQDWCISRQSWWGHRIPAFKLEGASDIKENWVVADSKDEASTLLGSQDNVVQDPDVLDTWFSSSLLPLTVSGWPNQQKFASNCHNGHFPLHMMETGFDILTYWVSKMAMISLALTDKVPFKLILLHGMICDSSGKKMSKSIGNVIDPLDVIDGASLETLQGRSIEAHNQGILDSRQVNPILQNQKRLFPQGIPECGADGLRAYLLSHDFQEEVVRISIDQLSKVRRLSNKIWNIYRFFLPILEAEVASQKKASHHVGDLDGNKINEDDQQVLEQLSKCVFVSNDQFDDSYMLHLCFNQVEFFMTVSLSQNYIANVKDVLLGKTGTEEDRWHKIQVLNICLTTAIKLLHPFMPHLTEFLHQKLTLVQSGGSVDDLRLLSCQQYPRKEDWSEFYRKYLEKIPPNTDNVPPER